MEFEKLSIFGTGNQGISLKRRRFLAKNLFENEEKSEARFASWKWGQVSGRFWKINGSVGWMSAKITGPLFE